MRRGIDFARLNWSIVATEPFITRAAAPSRLRSLYITRRRIDSLVAKLFWINALFVSLNQSSNSLNEMVRLIDAGGCIDGFEILASQVKIFCKGFMQIV